MSQDLSRFTYKSDHPLPSCALSDAVRPGPSRPAPTRRSSDVPLVRLSRCIVCDLHWTSRKTPLQKRTHIEQCAKKNGLSKDTVKILFEKEFVAENASVTLMDSVVSTAPTKKYRRRRVVPTVRSLPETRESILDRARDILGRPNTTGHADPQFTQQFARSALADVNGPAEEPPLTQPFGASTLGGPSTAQ